jgi:hypothetical protein
MSPILRSLGGTMNKTTRTNLDYLWSNDRGLQNQAFIAILKATDKPVDWAYAAWDEVVANLSHKDNHNRAIAAQVLCNLAKSDPKGRILKDFDALLAVAKDERFVTARHCLLALWKIGLVGTKQRQRVLKGLEQRYVECVNEKNGKLIRSDIIQGLRQLHTATGDAKIEAKALALIETEDDLKYRKKYVRMWRTG